MSEPVLSGDSAVFLQGDHSIRTRTDAHTSVPNRDEPKTDINAVLHTLLAIISAGILVHELLHIQSSFEVLPREEQQLDLGPLLDQQENIDGVLVRPRQGQNVKVDLIVNAAAEITTSNSDLLQDRE
jgi:hypothetical protein